MTIAKILGGRGEAKGLGIEISLIFFGEQWGRKTWGDVKT